MIRLALVIELGILFSESYIRVFIERGKEILSVQVYVIAGDRSSLENYIPFEQATL